MKIYCQTGEEIDIPYESLVGANLDGLNLHRAILEEADLRGSSCIATDFRGALLVRALLSNAILENASFITAFLMYAEMRNVKMMSCRAMSCDFNNTNLQNANLDKANINNADFSNSYLQGATMTCIDIHLASFKGALYDEYTIWPENFDPKMAGCIFIQAVRNL